MGRPSLAAERTEQIVAAATRCVLRDGIASTSLERISEESGFSRSHIRHYVSSRDSLMALVWERISDAYFAHATAATAATTELEALLAPASSGAPDLWALLLQAAHDPSAAPHAARTLERAERAVADALGRDGGVRPPEREAPALVNAALGDAVRRALRGVTPLR